jgi:hypothetical protein
MPTSASGPRDLTLLRARRREDFQGFLRSFAGLVARRVTGARRARPRGRFFSGLAWSRVINWGRDYVGVRHYIFRNRIEGELGPNIRLAMEHGPPRAAAKREKPARSPPRA